MNCKDTKRAVKSLICGKDAELESIQQHLALCRRCNQRYAPVLAIVRSLENFSVPRLDEETRREFSAKLQARIREERPSPFGRWRSFLLWAGQSKLMRFRKALGASAAAIALVASLLGLLPQFYSDHGQPSTVVRQVSGGPPSVPDLPPAAADAISILGADGFVSGVFSGWVQPGYFFGEDVLDQYDILEALDYLLS